MTARTRPYPRRFKQQRPGAWLLLAVLAILVVYRLYTDQQQPGPAAPHETLQLTEGIHRVERVIDGDTLLVSPRTRVRLIGVNTPETVKEDYPVEPWGPEASAFTKQFVASGKVRLQFDRERVDQHGRYLAYVWVEDRLLNEELARRGLARYEPQYHYSPAMKKRFRLAERAAQDERLGIWSGSSGQPAAGSRQ